MNSAARYLVFADIEAHGESAIYEALARGVSADAELIALLDGVPPAKRQPNLLFAAVRYLDGPVDTFAAFKTWTVDSWDRVRAILLARLTQTNEARRMATLLPLLAAINGPLALLEVGAAAGLCLYPDRWSYNYSGVLVGNPSLPVLPCEVSVGVPIPGRVPYVRWRAGLDLNPLDVTSADDVRWLECLIWPEHESRRVRLRTAIEIARNDPPYLQAGDLNSGLKDLAAQAPDDATLVVFHSAVLAYVTPEQRMSFVQRVRELPGHWISDEGPGVLRDLMDLAPVGDSAAFLLALDGEPKAWAGPHGQSLAWLD